MAVLDGARDDSATDAVQDNRLALTDQAMFLALRATGEESLAQLVWVYEHAVNADAVRTFHANLGFGLFGRRIETSPLPFGRHRWVAATGPAAPLDIEEIARPRTELMDWADERAGLPLDPETGPGWRLGMLPMTDGSTAISLDIALPHRRHGRRAHDHRRDQRHPARSRIPTAEVSHEGAGAEN